MYSTVIYCVCVCVRVRVRVRVCVWLYRKPKLSFSSLKKHYCKLKLSIIHTRKASQKSSSDSTQNMKIKEKLFGLIGSPIIGICKQGPFKCKTNHI